MLRSSRRRSRRVPRFQPSIQTLETKIVLSASIGAGKSAADVLSYHNDNARTGSDSTESTLTPANVSSSDFGKLFGYPVDGQVYAQPLYVQSIKMSDGKVHSVIYVATENDQVYALDATNPTAGPKHNGVLWHDSLINAKQGISPVTSDEVDVDDITPNIGITGTPVINPATNALYVVAKMQQVKHGKTTTMQKLYELNLSSGRTVNAQMLGTTTTDRSGQYVNKTAITASGIGAGSINGTVQFNALREDQRAGLAMDTNIAGNKDGMLVIAYSSHGDVNPYHGWVLGYNPRTLKLESTYNTIPDGDYGAIWQGGGAPSIAPNGDIYAAVGNGTFDAYTTTAVPGASALGLSGPGLGYESLNRSVAISFNAVDPTTGTSGTGLYFNGVTPVSSPIAPNVSENLTGTGINFNTAAMDPNGAHTFAATIAYDGSTLSEAIRDQTTGALYVHNYANVDIPATVGGSTAYVGFGGSTDGLMSVENIQSWSYGSAGAPTSILDHAGGFGSNGDLTANGQTMFSDNAAQLTDGGGEEVGTVFANAPVDVRNFVTTFTFRFAMQSSDDAGSSSSSPTYPIGDGITFILQNTVGHTAGPDYGESVLALRPTGKTMTVVNSFTPTNFQSLIQDDKDLGSTAVVQLPSFPGTAVPNLVVAAGKSGTLYLLNMDNLGGYNASSDQVVQEITNPSGKGYFASPSYANGKVYYQAQGDVLRSYQLFLNPQTNTMNLVADPTTSADTAKYPGTSPATSSDGARNGIVWTIDSGAYKTGGPAILSAYDAADLGTKLFSSSTLAANQAGAGVKFVTPTIANGRVYAGLANEVDVYGLLAERNTGS